MSLTGTLSTNDAGERFIDNATVIDEGTPTYAVYPLAMPNRAVDGSDISFDGGSTVAQQGVSDGTGLNNVGLLVTTTGCVYAVTSTTLKVVTARMP